MKKLLIILLFLPMISLGQKLVDTASKKHMIKVKPSALLLGDLSVFYERELFNSHSLTIGLPMYFKRDIASMTIIKSLAPLFVPGENANGNPIDVKDILDDAEGLGSIKGNGFVFKYKFYFNINKEAMTGFYFSPGYYFKKFEFNIDASQLDLLEIYNSDVGLIDYPTDNYELDGDVRINTFSFDFGHQWIRNWFSIDLYIGPALFSLLYDLEEESGNNENNIFETEQFWGPRFGLNLGAAF